MVPATGREHTEGVDSQRPITEAITTIELPTYHLMTLHDQLRREMGFGVGAWTLKTAPSGKGRCRLVGMTIVKPCMANTPKWDQTWKPLEASGNWQA